VKVFKALGLDAVCSLVYQTLLEQPSFGIGDLAERLLLQEGEIRVAFDTLTDLTLLRPSREVPGELRAVSHERALQILLLRQDEELERHRRMVADSRVAVADYVADIAESRAPATLRAEQLHGLDAIQSRLEALTTQATTEVSTVLPGGPQPEASLEAARPLNEELTRRGVICRSLYQNSMRNDPANLAYARWLLGLGAQIRTAPVVPPRMILVDRSSAMLALDPANESVDAVVVHEPGVLSSLCSLFDQNWGNATPLEDGHARDLDTGLSSEEIEILRLLAQGLTDEAVGKRLGVSLRTVSRRMDDLMSRLGASSRFEAGLRAKESGWL
jgi:ATP/maltotriose-dependent transcriptional regulator MalT